MPSELAAGSDSSGPSATQEGLAGEVAGEPPQPAEESGVTSASSDRHTAPGAVATALPTEEAERMVPSASTHQAAEAAEAVGESPEPAEESGIASASSDRHTEPGGLVVALPAEEAEPTVPIVSMQGDAPAIGTVVAESQEPVQEAGARTASTARTTEPGGAMAPVSAVAGELLAQPTPNEREVPVGRATAESLDAATESGAASAASEPLASTVATEAGPETAVESGPAGGAPSAAELGTDAATQSVPQVAPEPIQPIEQELSAEPDYAVEPSRLSSEPDALTNAPFALRRPHGGQPAAERAALTFESLWPEAERPVVRALEEAVAAGDYRSAVARAEQLVARALAAAAGVIGATSEAPRDPAVVALLLGLEGHRYLEFRALVRDTRVGRALDQAAALGAYAFAIEVRLARRRVGL